MLRLTEREVATGIVSTCVLYTCQYTSRRGTRSLVSRWLPRDLINMPLRAIDAEIASIANKSRDDRSIADVERLADLREAKRRLSGGRCAH